MKNKLDELSQKKETAKLGGGEQKIKNQKKS